MPKALFLALTNVTPGADEAEFNKWYNEHHVTDLLREIAPIVAATRYRAAAVPAMTGMPLLAQRYVTVYEIEAKTDEDLMKISKAMEASIAAGKVDISPTLDINTAAGVYLLPLTERRTV